MGKDVSSGKIQSIERMVNIMNQFSLQHTEIRFTDLVKMTGLNKSTAFNIISTMEACGILEQNEGTRSYLLGTRLIKLGDIAKKSIRIIDVAKPFMVEIRDKINETVQLAKLSKNQTVYLEKVESKQPIQTISQVGDSLAAHATGLGKVLLAYKPIEYIETYLPEKLETFTSNTITSRIELLSHLDNIRALGYAVDREEYIDSLICVAAPIFDSNNKAAYAISISVPSYRLTHEGEQCIKDEIVNAARKISIEIGGA